jgi:hypothetical protein
MAGWSGLYDHIGGDEYSLLVNEAGVRHKINKLLRKRSAADTKALFDNLLGTAPGTNVEYETAMVEQKFDSDGVAIIGGNAEISNKTLINRPSTVSDVTILRRMVNNDGIPTYPEDLSGNVGNNNFMIGKTEND